MVWKRMPPTFSALTSGILTRSQNPTCTLCRELTTSVWRVTILQHPGFGNRLLENSYPSWINKKTAFIMPQDLYEFRVVPFRLTNAPSVLQQLMQHVLSLSGLSGWWSPQCLTRKQHFQNPGGWGLQAVASLARPLPCGEYNSRENLLSTEWEDTGTPDPCYSLSLFFPSCCVLGNRQLVL